MTGMGVLFFLASSIISATGITVQQQDENMVAVRAVPRESATTRAVIVPVLAGREPEVISSPGCSWSFGRKMIAAGIEVVPLLIESTDEDVSVFLKFNASLDRVREKGEMAKVLFPWLAGGDHTEQAPGYLIIVPDEFYDNILPLARWKERKGFVVWVKKTSETGTQREQIREYIRTAYQTWVPRLTYVLLVGAINKIPAFPTPGATSCVTDHTYACVDGDDYLADLFVGRLPAANISELDCIVAKTVNYEANPWIQDTSWFRRALMVGTSYQEGGTPAVTALVTKRRIREQLLNQGFFIVDTVFYPPTPSGRGPVDSAVNRGVLFVNGRGWGQATGWNYPQFQINDVYNLNNGWKLPIVTSIYCGTGNYQANPCFGEAWLRAGTPAAPKGAVAFWGSSYTGTSTRWNNCMDYGIYHAIFNQGVDVLGPAMYAGKLEQLANFPLPADSGDLIIYFHVYNLLGDPALQMWTAVPQEIDVFYPGTYPVGLSSFDVYVRDRTGMPVADALVCLYKPDETPQVRRSDNAGRAHFAITTNTPDTVFITVTGENIRPHFGYSIGETRAVFVGHFSHHPETLSPGVPLGLSVRLKNFGTTQTANGVRAVLRAGNAAVMVIDSVREYGAILPGEEVSTDPFNVLLAPSCTSGQRITFLLEVRSGDSIWHSAFTVAVDAPTFRVSHYTVFDANGFLDPGETAEISVTLVNSGQGWASGITGVLSSSNPAAVTVVDSLGGFGDIAPGDSVANNSDRFQVRAAAGIGVGRKFLLSVLLRGSNGVEQTVRFPITVGEPAPNAPLGPDYYGYYGYDDTDLGYSERPQFNWVEIDPARGGAGTRLNLQNDRTVTIDLPFSFRFYGWDYRTISIADNGYIAMGRTSLSDQYNWHIPSAQGPDGLIAVFWDDFRPDTLGASGVFYYYDEVGHRLIVEWSGVFHVHGFRSPRIAEQQTFQAIIYDPAYHQTLTGDGPIVLQYSFVQNDDTVWGDNHNYATVGIQSPDHEDGLEWTYAGRYPVSAAEVVPGRAIKFTTNPPDTFTFIKEEKARESALAILRVFPTVTNRGLYLEVTGIENGMVRVFDIAGKEVWRFSGEGRFWWNLRDVAGKEVGAGVYFVQLTDSKQKGKIREQRVVVLK